MPLSDEARISSAEINYATNIITAGVAAWIAYDYLLTVRRESRLFWKRKVTAASILFFVNRYVALFYYVFLAYYRCLKFTYPGCRVQISLELGIRYFEYLPWAVFSALRVHALTQKNWFLSSFTFFWSVLAFPVDLYGDFHHRTYSRDPASGCVSASTTPTFLSLIGTGFIRGGQTIADVVVIGVTWKTTYEALKEGSMSSLLRVMFKNGTLYFAVLLVLNILHMLSIFLPNSVFHIPSSNTSYVPKVSEPLTAILVSRFMLDLHEANRALAHQGSDLSTMQIMSLNIAQTHSSDPEELEHFEVAYKPASSRAEP